MKSKPNLIELLMQELAPATPEIAAIVAAGERRWAVRFDAGTSVDVEAAPEPERLVLSARLGRPDARAQIVVCETLLSYNLLWRETGGVKTALAPDGQAVLLFELQAEQLQLAELRTVMINFSALVRVWVTYVESESGIAPAPSVPDNGLGMWA